jgi:hypothetical protein
MPLAARRFHRSTLAVLRRHDRRHVALLLRSHQAGVLGRQDEPAGAPSPPRLDRQRAAPEDTPLAVQGDGHHALVKLRQAEDMGLAALAAPGFEPLAPDLRAGAAVQVRKDAFEPGLDIGKRGELGLHPRPQIVRVGGEPGGTTVSLDNG